MPLLLTWHVLATSLALGQVTVVFRDGQSPSPAYAGTRDATIRDGAETPWRPDTNYDNLDDYLGGGADPASTLLKFDLSPVPPGTPIQGAALLLHAETPAPTETFSVYQCLKPWTPTSATWDLYDGVTAWAGAGATGAGDHGALPVGTYTAASGTRVAPLTDAGVALVQAWIDGSSPNNGFILQEYAAGATAAIDPFDSSSFVDRPQLVIGLTSGGTQVIDAGWDTTIASARDPKTVNDNTEHLNADGRPGAAALVAFDLSAIPPWSTVTASTLILDCPNDGTAQPYSVYAAGRPWVEDEACWNTYAVGQPWATPGADGTGDHGSTALAVLTGTGAPIQMPLGTPGAQLVQDWVRGVAPNDGFEIVEYNQGSDGIICHAREETTVSERPALAVTYLEGQFAFASSATAGGVGTALGPYTLERRRLDGPLIGTGAPPLPVIVTSSGTGGGFATDAGAVTWPPSLTVTFPAGATTSPPFFMRDTNPGRPAVLVSAGLPWQPAQQVQSVRGVRFSAAPSLRVPVGGEGDFKLQAVDSADLLIPVSLTARLRLADGGTPLFASISRSSIGAPGGIQVSGVAGSGAATLSVTDSRAETIRVCGSITGAPASELCSQVLFAQSDHLELALADPTKTLPLEGCATETMRLQMVDIAGNPVASPAPASICVLPDAGVIRGASTFVGESRTVGCVIGNLDSSGSATLELTPTFPVGFVLAATSTDLPPSGDAYFGLAWIAGPPAPDATDLQPRDAPGPLRMEVGRGISWVRMTPHDACGFSALPRSSEVTLDLPVGVVGGLSIADLDAGALDTPIQLTSCPAGAAPVFLTARIGNRPVVDSNGVERSITIEPLCAPRVADVGCACAAGPRTGAYAATLAMAAVMLRAARRRRAPARRSRRAAADP